MPNKNVKSKRRLLMLALRCTLLGRCTVVVTRQR